MLAPLDLDQLRTFVSIAEAGSFTKGAEGVFKTQSAVSMQMRRLEDRLGAALFARQGRGIAITSEGTRLLTYARRMLALSQETLSAFDDDAMAGQVRIGLPDDYAERFLPDILGRFSRSNPLVELNIACEPSSHLIEHVGKGSLDLALVSSCDHVPHDLEVVRREPLHFVTSNAHDVHAEAVLPLAMGRPDCLWRRQTCEALEAAGRRYRILFSSWSAQIVASAVLSGLAVSVLPECALRPGMRVLGEFEGFPRLPDTDISVCRSRNADGPVVSALVAHIRDCLANLTSETIAAEAPAARGRIEMRTIRPNRLRPGHVLPGF